VEVADPKSVESRFVEAKGLIRGNLDAAIELLQAVCNDFPEDAGIWFSLAGQLRRTGDLRGAADAAIRSFTSNWAFGMPPRGVLRMLQAGRGLIEDPVITRSERLTLEFGGSKTNDNYPLLQEIVSEYLESGHVVRALLMNQNYGYKMSFENSSFQERYDFDADEWYRRHTELCLTHLGDDRHEIA
ncbi:MAG: tetratricopeptide repeat-containing protein, partial [Holophagales bacterium]|nr:tetratricopeptide repeat-containing protein [Holophagales bacterium]